MVAKQEFISFLCHESIGVIYKTSIECRTYAWFPPFPCRSSVAVSPLPFPYTVAAAVGAAYLFAVNGCNGTEFSYVIFTEQRNFTTVERRNGNGRTATE